MRDCTQPLSGDELMKVRRIQGFELTGRPQISTAFRTSVAIRRRSFT